MFVAKEITIMYYKCPPCKNDVMESGLSFKKNFKRMFENPSPWQGINQTLFGTKKKVEAPIDVDDEYELN